MKLDLDGQVAVVVGGARGLGRAIAEGFLAEQARVTLVDRDAEVEQAAQALSAAGSTDVQAVQADVTDYPALEKLARDLWQRHGRVDHIVFAAGIGSGKFGFPFWKLNPADWDRVLRVNLIGGANVAHAFAPAMAEARAGTFLFIASVAGQIGSQTDPPYSASKAGLINFAQCAAKDLAPYGVRVNSLCPGMIKSALNRSVYEAWAAGETGTPPGYEAWAAEKIQKLVPLNRWQTPEDIAAMAVFLASARAHNVTGQTINVDGGYVMHW